MEEEKPWIWLGLGFIGLVLAKEVGVSHQTAVIERGAEVHTPASQHADCPDRPWTVNDARRTLYKIRAKGLE